MPTTQPATHYNYFRDYDPAAGKFLESDPVGLRGGMSTYAYVNNAPVGLQDPWGFFALSMTASWSLNDGLDYGSLGTTDANFRNVRCTCACKNGEWRVVECRAFLYIEVELLGKYSSKAQEQFARKGEQEHVNDFKAGAARFQRAGERAERELRRDTFSTQEDCETTGATVVFNAIDAVRMKIWNESLKRDTSGSHTWR